MIEEKEEDRKWLKAQRQLGGNSLVYFTFLKGENGSVFLYPYLIVEVELLAATLELKEPKVVAIWLHARLTQASSGQ